MTTRLILGPGDSFSIGAGSAVTTVFGTATGVERLTLAAGARVVLDASFNQGGDVITLAGNASSYTAVRSGSSIILTDALGGSITIPVGTVGASIAFADAPARTLQFDTLTSTVRLGADTVGTTGATLTAGTGGAAVGQTFTLTTGVDTGAAFTGGAANDTFNAVQGATGANPLTAGDSLTGGAGSDTLQITTTAAAALGTSVVATGIETVSFTATGGAVSLDAALFTGVTAVSNTGSANGSNVTVTGLTAIPVVSVTAANNSTTVTLPAAATIGTADAITVNLNGANVASNGTITADGIEVFNVATSGSASGSVTNNTAVTVASNTMTTLNVTGSADARIAANLVGATAVVQGVVTSDAGAHDIAITADATDALNVSLGAGNDTLRIANINPTHTLAGGEGVDTLVTTAGITTTTGANISGFEAVTITGAISVQLPSANVVTTLTKTDGVAATFVGLAAGGTVVLQDTAAAALTLTNATGWTGASDALTVTAGRNTTTGAFTTNVSAVGIETVTVNNVAAGADASARTVTVTSSTMTSLTVTGSQANTITGGGAALRTVDASAVSGNVTVGAALTTAAAGFQVTGGSGNDGLTGGAGNDTLIGGVGNDTLTGAAGADSLSGGAGNDNITGGLGRDTLTGGDGIDTFVFAANATDNIVSSSSASDTITDFTSGTDKIDASVTTFLGNFTNIQQALAANAVAGTPNRAAAYVTGENNLYIFTTGATGTLNTLDTVIRLEGVTALTAADFLLGAQGTGNAITLTAAAAQSTNTANNANARATTAGTNTPIDSAQTTTGDDTISSVALFLVNSTLAGGLGNDTLALSMAASTASSGGGTATLTSANLANVTGFEAMTLANFSPAVADDAFTYNIELNAANIASNSTLTVTSSYSGLRSDGFTTNNLTFDANNIVDATSRVNFTGAAANDSVRGGAGNDTLSGGAGNDTLRGGAGSDVLSGGAGNDTLDVGTGDDSVDGGAGNDVIVAGANLTNADTIIGGTGTDELQYTDAGGTNELDNVSGIETVTLGAAATVITSVDALVAAGATLTVDGSGATTLNFNGAAETNGAFSLVGAAGVDTLTGGAGADTIVGAGGADVLTGGAGNDIFIVAAAADHASGETIVGGTGVDTVRFTSTTGGETLTLRADVTDVDNVINVVVGTAAGVTTGTTALDVTAAALTGTLAVSITGNDGNNVLTGTANADTLIGGGGDDNLVGGNGNDSLTGGAGADTLNGGAGSDTLVGGEGADIFQGGAGLNSIDMTETTAAIDTLFLDSAGSGNVTTVTAGFSVANDLISLTAGAFTPTGGTNGELVGTDNGAIAAGATDIFVTAGTSAGTVNASAVAVGVVKLTGAASSFAAALGTTSITTAAITGNGKVLVMYYDSSASQLVIGAVDPASDGTNTNITQNDLFFEMGRVAMTAGDYSIFTAANTIFA